MYLDLLVHVLMYVGLAIVWLRSIIQKSSSQNIILLTAFLCFTFGIIMETLQYLLPLQRSFSIMDIFANGVGVIIGVFLFKKMLYFYK